MIGYEDTYDGIDEVFQTVNDMTVVLHDTMKTSYTLEGDVFEACREAYQDLVSACIQLKWAMEEMEAAEEEEG